MKEIKIHTDYIELQSLLKLTSIISTGGEAKIYLSQNSVLVDGKEENRRGRKIYPGSKVEVEGQVYLISK